MKTQNAAVADYNDKAHQALLKALTGGVGDWVRHDPGTNVTDLIRGHSNDNSRLQKPVQLDLFPETLVKGE